jgi:hypothetical protein
MNSSDVYIPKPLAIAVGSMKKSQQAPAAPPSGLVLPAKPQRKLMDGTSAARGCWPAAKLCFTDVANLWFQAQDGV